MRNNKCSTKVAQRRLLLPQTPVAVEAESSQHIAQPQIAENSMMCYGGEPLLLEGVRKWNGGGAV